MACLPIGDDSAAHSEHQSLTRYFPGSNTSSSGIRLASLAQNWPRVRSSRFGKRPTMRSTQHASARRQRRLYHCPWSRLPLAIKNAIRAATEYIKNEINPQILREVQSYNEKFAATLTPVQSTKKNGFD